MMIRVLETGGNVWMRRDWPLRGRRMRVGGWVNIPSSQSSHWSSPLINSTTLWLRRSICLFHSHVIVEHFFAPFECSCIRCKVIGKSFIIRRSQSEIRNVDWSLFSTFLHREDDRQVVWGLKWKVINMGASLLFSYLSLFSASLNLAHTKHSSVLGS